jgi:bleomycin hydrolase
MLLRAADRKEIQKVKEDGLSDIYKILVANLGEPPVEFTWMGKSYNPQSFRKEFVHQDMIGDYVLFMNDPTKPYYRTYTVDNSRNCYEFANWTFLNLPAKDLLDMGLESLKQGKMFCFSAGTDAVALMMGGSYHTDLYKLEDMLDISLDMSKEDLVRSCEIKSAHAIAMAGVRLDKDGRPESWLIENSFGEIRGWSGFVVMQNEWLEKYMFRLVVEKQFVPQDIQKLAEMKPKVLESWNPTY